MSERQREPFWMTEADVLWDERADERERQAIEAEDAAASRVTSSDGTNPVSVGGN